ncbi:MAG: TatD family hydrolase [Anaerolineales bacterium]
MTSQQQNLTDTHCHLNISAFKSDLSDVLERARFEGIQRMLIPGMDLKTSRFAVEISQDIPEAYAAVGVHPHYADSWNDEVHEEIRELARSPKVVAIGEIGLDFYRNLSSHEAQISAFRDQLQLASELELPVVIHNREAIAEILEIIVPWAEQNSSVGNLTPGVLHAYSADADSASVAITHGFYLGVAGPITFQNAKIRREITARIPLDRLLLETDSPYMSPHPLRGKRNEPANIKYIAQKLSDLFELNLSVIAENTAANANELFRWNNGTENRYLL